MSDTDVRTISTVILSLSMIGFALAFHAQGSAAYIFLLFIGIVLALMVAAGMIESSSPKNKK